MSDNWYYTHDEAKSGPFSDQQLRDLADCGEILRSDTIWKEGVSTGVVAARVKNLFPIETERTDVRAPSVPTTKVKTNTPPINPQQEIPEKVDAPLPISSNSKPETITTGYQPPVSRHVVRQFRAVAGNGALIVGQDGVSARIKKKCVTCGAEDSSYQKMKITVGLNKSNFFCPKCRKMRNVEFRGFPK